jgi:hypothetical protein
MDNEKLLFTFDDLSVKDKAAKAIMRIFEQHHAPVVQQDVTTQIRRTSGVSYREMNLVFADSQTVTLRIKQSGDVYQVLVNKKLIPIKHQDNHKLAVIEIANVLNAGRRKWQEKLARATVKLPPGIRTPAPRMIEVLTSKRDALKEAIADIRAEIATLNGEAANG